MTLGAESQGRGRNDGGIVALRILTRGQVAGLLTFPEYVNAVERAFRLHAEGRSLPPQLMHVDAKGGEFHVKGGGLLLDRWYFALKANGSFFDNPAKLGLPAIQGGILLFDGENGTPLALMDSGHITVQRTGAATAVAARLLARPGSRTATVCGCGKQGRIQLAALLHVLPQIERVHAWDVSAEAARRFAEQESAARQLDVRAAGSLEDAVRASDVVVTCTPSRSPLVRRDWVAPGAFIAAVGADSPGKQELEAELLAAPALVVVDLLEQAAAVGDLQHALRGGLMTRGDVHAELADVIVGRRPGRTRDDQVDRLRRDGHGAAGRGGCGGGLPPCGRRRRGNGNRLTMAPHEATGTLCNHRPGCRLRGGRRCPPRPGSPAAHPAGAPLHVVEATIPEMRAAMEQGRVTSQDSCGSTCSGSPSTRRG